MINAHLTSVGFKQTFYFYNCKRFSSVWQDNWNNRSRPDEWYTCVVSQRPHLHQFMAPPSVILIGLASNFRWPEVCVRWSFSPGNTHCFRMAFFFGVVHGGTRRQFPTHSGGAGEMFHQRLSNAVPTIRWLVCGARGRELFRSLVFFVVFLERPRMRDVC